jgi:chromosome segregation ATPase
MSSVPPLPPPPASYNKITGRLVSQGPPTILTVTALFSISLAGWQYSLDNSFIAGSFTAISIVVCGSACCFWKYVGAKAIEDSAGDMQSTVFELNERIEWFKAENKKLADEVAKFDTLITKWAQEESVNLDMYKKSTGELAITADAFKARVEEVEKFVEIHIKFETGILKLKDQLLEFKKIAPDVRERLQVLTEVADVAKDLPEKLNAKITNIATIDDELIGGINEFCNYVAKFMKCTKVIIKLYEQTKKERDDFELKVDELDKRNGVFKDLLDRYKNSNEDLIVRAELLKQIMEGINPKVEPAQLKPKKIRKKKPVREPL